MTVEEWLQVTQRALEAAGITTAQLDSEVLLAYSLQQDRAWLRAHNRDVLTEEEIEDANHLVVRREQREPVAYLVGYKEFYGRNFLVTREVLIPRPETEDLIELAKKHGLQGQMLDVGTGSGCLGLTLALETGNEVVLSDISDPAINVARQNAEALGVNGALFTHGNLLGSIPNKFDVIAANLPYVDVSWERSPETNHEPQLALFAGDNGLDLIKQLIDQAPAHLNAAGYVLLEADPEQHTPITEYAASNFEPVEQLGYGLLLKLR